MARRIVIAEDVRVAPPGGELLVPADALVTAGAQEVAVDRRVRIAREGRKDATEIGTPAPHRQIVVIGSDHAGYELKEYLKRFLTDSGYVVEDVGTHSTESVDYPDFARTVAENVARGQAWRGIVVDAAGIGSSIAANKVPRVRAALCYERGAARVSREHNDANVLALGARLLRPAEAREITSVWLATPFAGGRHQRRLDKITALEGRRGDPSSSSGDDDVHQRLVEEITSRVLDQLAPPRAAEACPSASDAEVCPGCDQRCVARCPERARRIISAGASRLAAGAGPAKIPADIAGLIDHTLLRPEASATDILKLCEEAREFGFASVCVNPTWVAAAARALDRTRVKVGTVAGFPLGATLTTAKGFEAEQAVKLGAQEVDMVMNVGALKSREYERVQQDIRAVAEICHNAGAITKVILECALLTDEEKLTACCLAENAGADYVKTSTGFGPSGATAHDVELMRLAVGSAMGVKAAGGIRTYEDLQKMLVAGATRIGASASVAIVKESSGGATPAASRPPVATPRY